MARNAKLSAKPRLQFPEFIDAWNSGGLIDLADFVGERISFEMIEPKDYLSTESILPDFGGAIIASRLPPTGSATRFRPGDVLVSNIRPYLKKVWVADRNGGASNDVIVLRARPPLRNDFFAFLLRNDAFIDYVMQAPQGLKMPRGEIGLIRKYPVAYPTPPAQKKIADCLISLEACIAAQGLKTEALKNHKRGLIQQLFPREGETIPRLRFPEFRNAGGWGLVEAGKLFANRTEKGSSNLPIYSVTMTDGLVKRSSLDRRIDDLADAEGNKKVHERDIAYNMMRMWQGACGVAPENCTVSPAYIVLAPQKDVQSDFYGYLFKLPQMLRILFSHSRGVTEDRLRLYYQDFSRILLSCPQPHEQRRIADCLSSLDAQISAETERLTALRTHKKGLMQQLFPSPKSVEA